MSDGQREGCPYHPLSHPSLYPSLYIHEGKDGQRERWTERGMDKGKNGQREELTYIGRHEQRER